MVALRIEVEFETQEGMDTVLKYCDDNGVFYNKRDGLLVILCRGGYTVCKWAKMKGIKFDIKGEKF